MAKERGATADDVARWMAERVAATGVLDQAAAAERIAQAYGPSFASENGNGTWAIARPVLAGFRKLTARTVVWDRSILAWRLRTPDDPPAGRQSG